MRINFLRKWLLEEYDMWQAVPSLREGKEEKRYRWNIVVLVNVRENVHLRNCIFKISKTNDTLNRKIRSISTESFPALWTGCRVFVLIKLICFVLSNCPLRIGANRRGWWTRARWEYTFYIGCISAALTKNNFHHFTRKGIYLKESRVAFNGWKITREYSRKGRETFPDISPSLYFC